MTTSVNLTEQELADLKSFTNQVDDAAAIRFAMVEYLRFTRRMRLKALPDTVQMEDNRQSPE